MKLNTWYKKRTIEASAPTKVLPVELLPKTEEILKAIIQLNKAMDNKDWNKLYKDHQPAQDKIVDQTYHVANSNVPDKYNDLIKGKKTVHVSSSELNGISPKVIHKIGNDTFMTKPYMSSRELPKELPTSGWGIMTTRNLYHAGEIGDLVEKVHATTIKDSPSTSELPVTVHHFENNYTEASELEGGGPKAKTEPKTKPAGSTGADLPPVEKYENLQNINPMHARHIGLMDYLVGNFDRHSGNLLVGDTVDGSGYKPLKAIDHDRSFYYSDSTTSPKNSYKKSSMGGYLGENASEKTGPEDKQLSDWWKDKKHDIYNEMNRNLQAIKDDSIRKYVRNNFDERFKTISTWADSFDKTKKGLFNDDTINSKNHPLHPIDKQQVKEILDNIPADHIDGMEMLTDLFKDRRGPDKKAIIKAAILDQAKKMSPTELVRFYSRMEQDPELKDAKADVLMDMKNDPVRYSEHLKQIIKANNSLPDYSKFLNPFWEKHIEDSLKEEQQEKLKEAN